MEREKMTRASEEEEATFFFISGETRRMEASWRLEGAFLVAYRVA